MVIGGLRRVAPCKDYAQAVPGSMRHVALGKSTGEVIAFRRGLPLAHTHPRTSFLALIVPILLLEPVAAAQGLEGRPLPSSSSTAPSWEIGGGVSYLAPPIRGGSNPFGAGFGGRLGFSTSNVYLGVSVIDYLGSQDVDLTTHSLLYGGEVGYGFTVQTGTGVFFTVRPEAGVGGLTLFYTTPTASSLPASSATVKTRANVDVVTTASASSSVVSGSSSSSSGGSSSNPHVLVRRELRGREGLDAPGARHRRRRRRHEHVAHVRHRGRARTSILSGSRVRALRAVRAGECRPR